ncbi:MAG: hypothetical protein ACRELY_32845, partial [Polyangiaceae bacterium]
RLALTNAGKKSHDMWMRQFLTLALFCSACASSPPPKPAAQPEVPIRTDDEIADDQRSGAGPGTDPCAGHPNAPGCRKNGKGGAFDDTAHRNRFVHDDSGKDNPLNPAMQSR